MALSFSVFNRFRAIDDVSAPMRRMEKSVSKFGRTTQNEFRKSDRAASSFAKKIKSLAAIALTAISVQAVTAQLTQAIAVGAQFEQTMVNAAAKFGDVAKKGSAEFQKLEKAAMLAGKTTEFTSSQAAEALNFLAMAGFNTVQSIAALPGVIDLATAAQVELNTASDMATDSLGSFNLIVKDSIQLQKNLARVNDVMAKTTTTSNTNFEQLFETFKDAGPVATSLGASIETVSAMAGALANAGIKGSESATALKNVFLRLAAATPAAQKQLNKFKVSLKDSKGGFRDVLDIMGDLEKSLSKLGAVDRAKVLDDIFGMIPIAGVNVLMATGAKNMKEYRSVLEKASGTTTKMAKEMRSTTQNLFKEFDSAKEGAQIVFFKAMQPVIDAVTNDLVNLTRAFDSFLTRDTGKLRYFAQLFYDIIKTVFKTISVLTGFISKNEFLISSLGKALVAFLAIKTAMLAFNGVLAITNTLMAMNPIGLAVIATIALVAAIKEVIENWDYLKQDFILGFDFIKSKLEVIGDLIYDKLLGPIESFAGGVFRTLGFGALDGPRFGENSRQQNKFPISPNAGVLDRQESVNTSRVDLNLNNVPQGSEVKQTGNMHGIKLKMGYSGAY